MKKIIEKNVENASMNLFIYFSFLLFLFKIIFIIDKNKSGYIKIIIKK